MEKKRGEGKLFFFYGKKGEMLNNVEEENRKKESIDRHYCENRKRENTLLD